MEGIAIKYGPTENGQKTAGGILQVCSLAKNSIILFPAHIKTPAATAIIQ
jgi:hypothetical protein